MRSSPLRRLPAIMLAHRALKQLGRHEKRTFPTPISSVSGPKPARSLTGSVAFDDQCDALDPPASTPPARARPQTGKMEAAVTHDEIGLRYTAACAIAREAGVLARRAFRTRPRSKMPDFKGHQDFLTATDAEVEDLIRRRLRETFPNDGFFGEE